MATRELGPSGVALSESRLSDDTTEHLRLLLESKGLGDKNLDPFFEGLDNAFSIYFSCRKIDQASRPPKVRKNLQAASDAARKCLRKLEQLDGNSKILLDEARPGNFRDLFHNAIEAVNSIELALAEANRLPTTRPKMDYPKQQMALAVRHAIERHLGIKATSTKESKRGAIFNDVLSVMVGAVKQASPNDVSDANNGDVHKLTRRAKKGEVREHGGGALEFIPASTADMPDV